MPKAKSTDAPNGGNPPAVAEKASKAEAPRDERHDSIDPQTGALTEEALALRRERDNG